MLSLRNLTQAVREKMLSEIEADDASGGAYVSPRLTPAGLRDYPGLLRQAAKMHDDVWLTGELGMAGRLKTMEERRTKSGTTMVKVPYTAAETLAEGDFNRYYIRGLCVFLLETNPDAEVEVYRAKAVEKPRAESEAIIGRRFKAAAILTDLTVNKKNLDTALGIPAGPNSGLSVCIPA